MQCCRNLPDIDAHLSRCDAISPQYRFGEKASHDHPEIMVPTMRLATAAENKEGAAKCNKEGTGCTWCGNLCAPKRVQARYSKKELDDINSSYHDELLENNQKVFDKNDECDAVEDADECMENCTGVKGQKLTECEAKCTTLACKTACNDVKLVKGDCPAYEPCLKHKDVCKSRLKTFFDKLEEEHSQLQSKISLNKKILDAGAPYPVKNPGLDLPCELQIGGVVTRFSDTCSNRKIGTAYDDGSGEKSGAFVFVLIVLISGAVVAGGLFYVKQKNANANDKNLVLLNDYAQAI
jgi:hypothetical protein